jgi:plastocyanin
MKNYIKNNKGISFRWTALTLFVTLTVITVRGASASSSSKPASSSGSVQAVSTGAPASAATEVKIDNFVFNPAIVTVKVGTQVTWTNKDDIPHTVDSTDGKFKSNALDTEDKFQFSFNTPGEYQFFCRLHPKMTGKIVVQP